MTKLFSDPQFHRALEKRSAQWHLKTKVLELGDLPQLMGIVNVTPDSFSDGGKFYSQQNAVDHALRLADEGADILDIGGESTRPYSESVSQAEEIDRVVSVVQAIANQVTIPISVDTSKAAVAELALEAGAEIINDVTGLEGDPGMIDVAVKTKAGICAMHMQGTPQTMQDNPAYKNVVTEISEYLKQRFDALIESGVQPEKICLDPGIGFGKTTQHNLDLLKACWKFHDLGAPILVGHSRKGFIGKIFQDMDSDRTAGTIGIANGLALQGVQVIRVHDVKEVRQSIACLAASI